jgi:hypothetical protein
LSKKRIIRNSTFNENVVGSEFLNTPSSTIFRLGSFTLDTNLESRVVNDFTNRITTFSKEYTLENIGIDEITSQKIYNNEKKLRLNLDYNEITSYSRYGSVEELFKFTVKNIIQKYPYSIQSINQLNTGIINTVLNFSYDDIKNESTFRIPVISLVNLSEIFVNSNNFIPVEDNPLKNFNLTKEKYVVWGSDDEDVEYPIIGFTGNTQTDSFITLKVVGKLFNMVNTTLSKKFHIKPSKEEFSRFLFDLNDIEKYFLSHKNEDGFTFKLKEINDDGTSFYTRNFVWPTSDEYNIDINTVSYNVFLTNLIKLGYRYDHYKTDIIYRLYTTESLKEFDTTNDLKIKKLIRAYGFEFDKIRRLADGFATLNNLTYKKEKSIPDILVKNLAKVLGWEVFDIVQEEDLLNKVFSVENKNVSESSIPSEIDIELWRRILINTKWFLKSKGTRKSLETIFKLVGIPEEFILLKEYIYLAENKLELEDRILSITRNPDFSDLDVVNESSFDDNGYPIAVRETNDFFFQISGNTDSGQTYINRFRENGFVIDDIVDNKKSWVITRENEDREDYNTFYTLDDSRLVINTKEIDIGLSPSQVLEMDVYNSNRLLNFPICNSGVTTNIFYINTPLTFDGSQQTVFDIPDIPQGDIQVSVNGITLTIDEDYVISGTNNNRIVLLEPVITQLNGLKDIISVTYFNDPISQTRNYLEYIVLAVNVSQNNPTVITLPEEPLGDIQLVLNGITLKPGKTALDGDYYINPINRTQIIITAEDINQSLKTTDKLSVMYFKEVNSDSIIKYADTYRITSFFSNKLFYNNLINKYIFVTDYFILDISTIKVTVNGITLTNNIDFTVDSFNKTHIVFSNQTILKINDVINVFYAIETEPAPDCIDLGVNIFQITFTDYLDRVLNNLIDVKNRKIITNNDGGLYPKLSYLYDSYLIISQTTSIVYGYTFNGLYDYIKKFDNHFVKFLNQLLPATTITRKSGVIVSNSIFTLQKHKYIRGINDGSEFVGDVTKLVCDLFEFTTITTPAKTTQDLGTVDITPTGFNGFVEYSIDGGDFFFFDNIFTDLLPGQYDIVLKDEIGCEITGSIEIEIDCSEFQIVDIIIGNVSDDSWDTSDFNWEDGEDWTSGIGGDDVIGASIEIIVAGDNIVEYSIDGGANFSNNNLFTNLEPGLYIIVVKSSLGCELTDTVIIQSEEECDVSITDFTFEGQETTTTSTTTQSPGSLFEIQLEFGSISCEQVCSNYGMGGNNSGTFYIDEEAFGIAGFIYTDPEGTNPAPPNFYTNGSICRASDGFGALQPSVPC